MGQGIPNVGANNCISMSRNLYHKNFGLTEKTAPPHRIVGSP